MSGRAAAAWLPDGRRLHLHHGPIDLVIAAEGRGRLAALAAGRARFARVLDELVSELPLLRTRADPGAPPAPSGAVARRMVAAVMPWAARGFVTPMAAVAGAVADEVLAAMRAAGDLEQASVNNGGDVALFLAPGRSMTGAVAGGLPARLSLAAGAGIGGVATSGWRGRSHSLGIADAVTALAADAAAADAAATMIANAVDLPGHPAIRRRPAREIAPDSDLGDIAVTVDVGPLGPGATVAALDRGAARAADAAGAGLILGALLVLGGAHRCVGRVPLITANEPREPADA